MNNEFKNSCKGLAFLLVAAMIFYTFYPIWLIVGICIWAKPKGIRIEWIGWGWRMSWPKGVLSRRSILGNDQR